MITLSTRDIIGSRSGLLRKKQRHLVFHLSTGSIMWVLARAPVRIMVPSSPLTPSLYQNILNP